LVLSLVINDLGENGEIFRPLKGKEFLGMGY